MAKRPVYIANLEGNCYFKEIEVELNWNGNSNFTDFEGNIESLHKNFKDKYKHDSLILEVSTKSKEELGKMLSAFNLCFMIKNKRKFTVESLFQGSKVFESGGPYQDLYYKPSVVAKKDERLKKSGRIIGFKYFNRIFDNYPTTFFYDWLYINTLYLNQSLVKEVLQYDAFTDIEFNPKYSINCQAKSLALFKSIVMRNELEVILENPNILREILIKNNLETNQQTLF